MIQKRARLPRTAIRQALFTLATLVAVFVAAAPASAAHRTPDVTYAAAQRPALRAKVTERLAGQGTGASGAAHASAVLGVQVRASSNCGLPASAGAGSGYNGTYTACANCVVVAASNTENQTDNKVWYCTYNPARNAFDLHTGARGSSVHCNLPNAAGANSGYTGSYYSCVNCAEYAADDTLNSELISTTLR
ncbi:hypothetical protein [Actinoplanes subtropicus]|uniref:hypothetical protein n=1 Tax=Actinoplanes subtropicus TaxID=543632 RepID=UPI0012F74955|nr:hypothetical protein [Actinoplanes subtropicus]